MTHFFRFATSAFLALSLTLFSAALPLRGAQAQYPAPMPGMAGPGMAQMVLSKQDIRNFLACYPKMQALGDKYDSRIDRGSLAANPAQALTAMQLSLAARAEVDALLASHGFSGMQHWISVIYSIALAHSWRDKGGDPTQQLDEAIAKIRANPNMTEQQRGMMIAPLEAQRGMLAAFTPPPENVELVEKFDAEISAALDR